MAKTVVLIDDDQDDLEIMKEAIKGIDPSLLCISFVYPEEAIRVISKELVIIPDYVFIDINMPGKTGDECLTELRGLKEFENTVITMFSTSMPDRIAHSLKKAGANFTFQKPVKMAHYYDYLKPVFQVTGSAA